MTVDIWSDVVCPWCYIGITRFERALERTGADVTIRIHPFQLDPDAPIPGVPAAQRYARKFGDDAPALLERVTREAAADGLAFHMDRALAANTFDAHRAIAYAGARNASRELERALFAAYFTDGLDVSDRDVLADRAESVGLDRAALAAHLSGDEGVDELRAGFVEAFERGITAVPAFVFNDEFVVPGAVDTQTFVTIINQMGALRPASS